MTPEEASSRSRTRRSARERGSMPAAGSSSRSTCGRWIRARARPRRCFCPRERTRAGVRAISPRWTVASISAALRSPVSSSRPWAVAKVMRISVQVKESQVPKASGIQPTAWWTWRGWVSGSSPAMRMVPSSGASRAASMSSRVVFPAPLGPTSPVTEPAGTVMLIFHTARVDPKKRVTPATSMLMVSCYGPSGRLGTVRGALPGVVGTGRRRRARRRRRTRRRARPRAGPDGSDPER